MNQARLGIAKYRGLTILYELLKPFAFHDHRGRRWIVPAGFVTDGASFPWWLRFLPGVLMLLWLVALQAVTDAITVRDVIEAFFWSSIAQAFVGYPIHSAYADAGVAHDWLYSRGMPRLFADVVFLVMICRRARELHRRFVCRRLHRWPCLIVPVVRFVAWGVLGYRVARAGIMFLFVVLLGWPAYNAHRRREREHSTGTGVPQ